MAKGMEPVKIDELLGSGASRTGQAQKKSRISVPKMNTGSVNAETFFGGKRKWATLGVVALLWGYAGYNKDWIWSPTDTADKILDAAGWIITVPDRAFDNDAESINSPSVSTPNFSATTQVTIPITEAPSSEGSNNLIPVLPTETSTVASTEPVTVPEHIPTFVYSGDANGGWEVTCYGPAQNVTINEQLGLPLKQIQEATNENWAVGQPNSQADSQLYEIVRQNVVTEDPLVLRVYTDCEGLDN